jgi:crossover junction endodeoxyribonuclease RuvC
LRIGRKSNQKLKKIIKKYQPEEAADGKLFFSQNVKTALSVGEARGAVILAIVQSGLELAEYTPLQVKQALTGYGRADKKTDATNGKSFT